MRRRTLVALGLVLALLGATALYGVAGGGGGQLSEQWVSDTSRENEVNHHPVGVLGAIGNRSEGLVVAPVAAVVNTEPLGPTSCSLVRLAADGGVRWRHGVPAANCTSHALTEPELADLDGDGAVEVAAGSTENAVLVLSAETGREEYRIPLETFGYGRPTAANLTAHDGPELVAADIGGTVVAATGEETLWTRSLNATTWAAPVVGDVDADGAPEVVFGTAEAVTALDAGGQVEWRVNVTAERLAVADADDDAGLELFATTTRTVRSIDGATGRVEWETRVSGQPALHEVGDGDQDGVPEAYVGVSGGTIVALNADTGREEWSTRLVPERRASTPPPTLGDLDGDGTPELVAVANDGTVVVLSPTTGTERAAYERSVPIWTEVAIADPNGDRRDEILVRYGDGRVVSLAYVN